MVVVLRLVGAVAWPYRVAHPKSSHDKSMFVAEVDDAALECCCDADFSMEVASRHNAFDISLASKRHPTEHQVAQLGHG